MEVDAADVSVDCRLESLMYLSVIACHQAYLILRWPMMLLLIEAIDSNMRSPTYFFALTLSGTAVVN